ncbi:MAG: cation transporter [Hyphomicrobiales bacterium]|nr:MAG: cation transporter [Hyphomicrobiales bacterium]
MPHDHNHHHHHGPVNGQGFGRAFAVGTVLNLGFVVIEAAYGILSNSMALVADAGHNFSDVIGLLLAWAAYAVSRRAPTPRFTYGLRSSSILAALANAMLLFAAVGVIIWEAAQRLLDPVPVAEVTMIAVAAVGILINAGTAVLFASGRGGDLNIRGAYLHMAADAGVSLGVVVAGVLIMLTGWHWVDPLVSLAIAGVIVWSTWSLMRESLDLALHAVPPGIDPDDVRAHLAALPGVTEVHDIHIWPMSTTETAMTAHLVMPAGHPGDRFLAALRHDLAHDFKIDHATVQIEMGDATACELAPESVI